MTITNWSETDWPGSLLDTPDRGSDPPGLYDEFGVFFLVDKIEPNQY